MNNRNKIAVVCATLFGLGSAIAGQNAIAQDKTTAEKTAKTQVAEQKQHDKQGKPHRHGHHGHHHGPHIHQMSEEQKAEFEKRRSQFVEQSKQACEGKLGKSVEFKIDNQTYKGTCELGFKPTKFEPPKDKAGELPPPPKMDFKPEHGKMPKFGFGREQRAAMDKQVKEACTGKVGQKVSISLDNNVKVDGTCEIHFQHDKPKFEQEKSKK